MSKAKKELRASRKAAREEQQARKVINILAAALLILCILGAIYAIWA